MKNNKAVIILIVILTLAMSFMLAGCKDYSYRFHYSVIGGNGEITPEERSWLEAAELCSESEFCELGDCPDGSYVIRRLGSRKGSMLTFLAIPDEGYQVKEWIFNGKVVEGNKTNTYTAEVSKKENYDGVIEVVFEKIPENQ